jgi:hypothetical protein
MKYSKMRGDSISFKYLGFRFYLFVEICLFKSYLNVEDPSYVLRLSNHWLGNHSRRHHTWLSHHAWLHHAWLGHHARLLHHHARLLHHHSWLLHHHRLRLLHHHGSGNSLLRLFLNNRFKISSSIGSTVVFFTFDEEVPNTSTTAEQTAESTNRTTSSATT